MAPELGGWACFDRNEKGIAFADMLYYINRTKKISSAICHVGIIVITSCLIGNNDTFAILL